jgi:PAS domain S-box-containing protein
MSSRNAKTKTGLPSSIQGKLRPDLYQEIFDHSREPIAIIDPQGRYLEQNAAHAELLGYSDADLKNQTPALHMGEAEFAEVVREVAEKGEYRGEVLSKTKGGEVKNIELSAFAERDESGETLCYIGIKHDITRRKQAEKALKRSEAELTDFFENAPIALHWVGPDGTVLRVNQAELDMLGYTREEFVGHNIAEFHADQSVIADILEHLKDGKVIQNYEARMRCKDGAIKYVRISSSVYWEAGKFIHTRCFTHDITERRRTESRLALQYSVTKILAESLEMTESARNILIAACHALDWNVGVLWKIDAKKKVMRCVEICHTNSNTTPDFDRISQASVFKKGEGLPGRVWESGKPLWIDNVVLDPKFPRSPVALREGLRGAFGFPILIGTDVWGVIEFFSSDIREPDDQLMKLVAGIGGQIGQFTQRRRAEEELASLFERESAARADAEKANRLKDEFLATLSHELRTPLNAVIGWSRMLSSDRLDRESSKHALEVIERNAWAQKQMIEDILDVSRVITGKLQLNLSATDLASVIEAALDAVRPAMEAKEIEVETVIDSNLRMISGDPDRLQQVVWNVLSNAAKFTPNGGRVEISVTQSATHVLIGVKDNGPGIDSDFIPHVFERFRQADGSTTRTHGGLGIGLAISRHLIELHGGTISVENRTNSQGANFMIRLPLPTGVLSKEVLTNAAATFEAGRLDQVNLEGLRILIVDDEADTLDLITAELAQHGATVTGVTNGSDALASLENSAFDLLVSDIGMPRMDGYQLIQRVRQQEQGEDKRIPAIALTAYVRVQDRMQAIMSGFSTHIAKPLEANELVTVVASLTGRLGKSS